MNRDSEKRFLISMLLMVVFLGFYIYMFNRPRAQTAPQETPQEAVATNVPSALQTAVGLRVDSLREVESRTVEIFSEEARLTLGSRGAGVSLLAVDGEWNQMETPVGLFQSVDVGYGALQWETESGETVNFALVTNTDTMAEWATLISWNETPVEVRVRYDLFTNYVFHQTISVLNRAREAIKIEHKGRSFVLRWRPGFIDMEAVETGNLLSYGVYTGERFNNVLQRGLFGGHRDNTAFVSNFQWLSVADNYFAFVAQPKTPGITASYHVETRRGNVDKTSVYLYFPILLLGGGEATNFTIQYYSGPRKESLLRAVNDTYGQLFRWPAVVGWFMKPIEWAMVWLLDTLGGLIDNKGIVIILIAIIIRLLLSPLSIKAAISIKKQQLLQPKIKAIQEKYKDNQQLLQQKTMELYKKEKINPLGGCLPMLLQIPVFFALFRVLSQSVELRGATFLWIRDLTQPDTLFTMDIPILPSQFNLLPIIMTVFQLIQTKLQTTRNPAMQGQALTMYILPVVFLFFFWNMPAGLVLYWTMQNVYTIVEQEIINLDRHIKL